MQGDSRITGTTSSSWEYAGNQDELLQLRAGLNEKELELIELREQHVQLAARSQEARTNWEAALTSKDRAIAQLEEALASRQRAIEQLIAATASTEQLNTELQDRDAQIQALEQVLAEARQKITALKNTGNEQKQQIAALQAQATVSSQDENRIEQLQQQLTQAFQGDLQAVQQRASQFEETVNTLTVENENLRRALSEREQQVTELGGKHQELKQQVIDLRDNVLGAEQKLAAEVSCRAPPSHSDPNNHPNGLRGSPAPPGHHAHATHSSAADGAAAASSAAAAAQQAASTSQVLEMQQQMLTMAMKLQSREFQARRYKEAVRALKARHAEAEAHLSQRDAQIAQLQASAPTQGQLAQQQQELNDRDRIIRKMLADMENLENEKREAVQKCEALKKRCDGAEGSTSESQAQLQSALDQLRSGPSWQSRGSGPSLQVACIGDKNMGLPLDTSVGELTMLRHRCLDAEQRLEGEEQRCVEAVRQLESAKERALEAQKYADEARRRVLAMEVRNGDNERSLIDARRACERQEQRAELAERTVRGLELQVVDADRRAKQAELLCSNAEQRMREIEGQSGDAERLARTEALRASDAEARMKSAEANQATAESKAADAEARLRESDRRLRDLTQQLSEQALRWRNSDQQRQSLDTVLHRAEIVARQARTDCDAELQHMQQVAESWREAMSRDLDELRLALEQALSHKGTAELRIAELETELARQARWTSSSRSDSDEVVIGMLESRLRTLEQSLVARDCTVAQLQAAVTSARSEGCQAVQSMASELEAKSLALADAEMRFTELEGLMQRIIGRTSALHNVGYHC